MDDDVRALGDAVGRAALARDWAGVHRQLAPWLRQAMSVDQVRAFFLDEYRLTLAESGIDGEHYREYPDPELGGNQFMNATQLRQPIDFAGGKVRDVSPEVTDENMRYWLKLQLLCSDDQMATLGFDFFCEVWMAVVTTDEGLRVGYWSQGAY